MQPLFFFLSEESEVSLNEKKTDIFPGGDFMKNFLKTILSNMKKDFDTDFEATFNKMEGKSFEQFMDNLKEKDEANEAAHRRHAEILEEVKRTGKSAAQIEHKRKYLK